MTTQKEAAEARSWALDRPLNSPFAHPRGLRGRLAGRFMVWTIKTDEVADLVAARSGERVLEVGYGGGELVRVLTGKIGNDGVVCGADPSADMCDLATRRNRRAVVAGKADLRVGTAAATGFPDETFDHVVTINTVAIWPDLDAGLRELYRVTRPGGDVVIAWHGGAAPTRIGRRLVLPESALSRIPAALAELFITVERHELTTQTAFRAVRA
jgi:SAM-dependent methyltransferase